MEKITAQHPLSHSTDIVKENLKTLKRLFPTIVKEGKIDIDELKALLDQEIESNEEYYRFSWAGKSEARREANKPSTATLRPNKADSKNWDTTGNIFIEGDNLEVLKLMQKSYVGKIKMIYIDPPYNTGNDFVYKDNYADNLGNYLAITGQTDEEGKKFSTNAESDGRYHSNWLNMMYPRLKLAYNLLIDEGVMFISIDDKEVSNLRKLGDEIFGEDNFLALLIWKSGRTAAAHFTNEHEYIIVYAKSKGLLPLFKFNGEDNISDRAIKRESEKNPVSIISFPKGMDFEAEDKFFPNEFGNGEKIRIVEGVFECKDKKLNSDVMIEAAWTMKDMIESWIDGEEVIDQKGQIVSRFFFKENGVLQYEKVKGTIHPKSIIVDYSTKNGTNSVKNLLGKPYFDFPKPPSLIQFFIETISGSDDIILDFFAGSGSTAQALMQQNANDGGNRKFICVQIPEPTKIKSDACRDGYNNIADICKDRISKAGDSIVKGKIVELKKLKWSTEGKIFQEETQLQIDNLQLIIDNLDTGFKTFKLDSSNIQSWDGSIENFEVNLFNAQNNIKEKRSEEDVLFEILLKYGLDLTVAIEEKMINSCNLYSIGGGVLFVCLSDNITTAVAEAIGKWKDELQPVTCRALFKDNGFKDDVAKTNSIQILRQYGIEEANSI